MKIDIMIVSVILVLTVLLPFFLLPLIQMRRNKKLQNKFLEEARRLQLNIDLKETWNLNIIGIDSVHKKLLFVRQQKDQLDSECIDLGQMQHSEVIIASSRLKRNGRPEEVLLRVDIEFTSEHAEDKKLLNLFDHDLTFVQDLEVKHAEKWNDHIRKHLGSRPILKKTA